MKAAMTDTAKALEAKGRGNAHFKAKEYAKAIEEYTEAIKLDGTQHSFYSNRSACHAGLENWQMALDDANKVIMLKPEWPKGYSRKGLPLFKQRKFREAFECYEEGLKHDPNNASLKAGLKEVERVATAKQGNQINALFGGLKEKLKDHPKFSAYLQDPKFVNNLDLLSANPQMAMQMGVLQDPRIQEAMGAVLGIGIQTPGAGGPPGAGAYPSQSSGHEHQGGCCEPEELLTEEEQAKKDGQKQAADKKAEGNTFYKKRKFDEAFKLYEEAADLDPEAPVYLLNQAAVRFMEKRFDECLELCEKAISVQEKHNSDYKWKAKAYVRMGNVAKERGDLQLAIDFYKKAQLEKKDPKVAKQLKSFTEQKVKADAADYLDEGKAAEAKDKGNGFYKDGKWKEAIEQYSDSLKRQPGQPKVHSNRATSYCKLMAWGPALEDCSKAIALDPKFLKPYIRKGKIHQAVKEYHKAVRSYKQGVQVAKETGQDFSELLREIQQIMYKVEVENRSGKVDPMRRARAEADPEVQAILQSPDISGLMAKASNDPSVMAKAMQDPDTREKIEYLMLAGIIRLG